MEKENISSSLSNSLALIKDKIVHHTNLNDSKNIADLTDENLNLDDLSLKENINEIDILNNLKTRFNENIFFTNIQQNLIYINPFCNEDEVFGNNIKNIYKPMNNNNNSEEEPTEKENDISNNNSHLFNNINKAILNIKKDNLNKYTFLLQGDSYSGKSKLINEAIKYLINYFSSNSENVSENNNINIEYNIISNRKDKNFESLNKEGAYYSIDNNINNLSNIPRKILASISILEAFCNSKNDNNDNSTRAINYIKLRFNNNFNKLIGMEIFPFLFDKNRISNLDYNKGCNFNVFYYLLNCNDSDLLDKLYLSDDIMNYIYLNRKDNSINNDASFNENKFLELNESFYIVGFNKEEVFTIFKILSAIILLGNTVLNIDDINFQSNFNQNEALLNVCTLLNIDINEFVSALINQESFACDIFLNNDNIKNIMKNGGHFEEKEEIEKIKNIFVNELYNQLFLWIVNKINNNINLNNLSNNDNEKNIIFLDFPGFENNYININDNNIVYLNSLEQIFINYINELILYFYFKGLSDYNNNDELKDEIMNVKNDIKDIINSMNYLFKEIKYIQNETQIKTFISNIIKDIKLGKDNTQRKYSKIKNKEVLMNPSDSKYFLIHHSYGDIYYCCNDILIKNAKNVIPWNLLDCLLKSGDPKIKNIYKNNRTTSINYNNSSADNRSSFNHYTFNYENIFNNSFITFCEEYKFFINDIKKLIKQSEKNYIICLKSNPNDDPLEFDSNYIFQKTKFYRILLSVNILKQKDQNKDKEIKMNIKQFKKNYENFINKYEYDDIDIYDKNQEFINKFIDNFIKDYNKGKNGEEILNNDNLIILKNDDILIINKNFYNILEAENNKIIQVPNNTIEDMECSNAKNDLNDCKKNEKSILKIQSAIRCYIAKNKLKNYNKIYYFIQNSLRIICGRSDIKKIKNRNKFLSIQLQLFLERIKLKENINEISKNKKNKLESLQNLNINNVENNLLNKAPYFNNKKQILFNSNNDAIKNEEEKNQEENNNKQNNNTIISSKKKNKNKARRLSDINHDKQNLLINKINKLDFKNIKNISQIKENNINLNIFQEKLLFKKVEKRKKNIKKIYNFAYTILASRYNIMMRKEIKIIQKYFKEYISCKKLLEKALDNYIERLNKNNLEQKINDILFPYRNENINKIKERYTLDKKDKYTRKDKDNNATEKKEINNKYCMSTAERYRLYKKKNQFFNINKENNLNEKVNSTKEGNLNNNSSIEKNKTKEKLINNNISILSNSQCYDNKIYFLSKIIDIDIFTDLQNEDEFNELLWVKNYKKIYEYNLKNKTPIQQIYLSDTHTLLINNIGNCFLYGMNDKGQCGIMNKNKEYIYADESLKNHENYNYEMLGSIKEAVLKDGYTLILNKQGSTYSFNDNEFNLEYLNTSTYNDDNSMINNTKIKTNIESIHGSDNFNLYLTKSKQVYVDIHKKPNSSQNIQPKNISFELLLSNKIKISSISCGYNFYILLSSNGKLYSGGSNLYNELCTKSLIKQRMSAEEIYEVSKLDEKIIQVSCGFKHVIILSQENNVYGWGNSTFGQVFSVKNKKCDLIKLNYDKNKKKIVQISAGFRSSFLLDENHEIYFFGILNKNKKNNGDNMEKIYLEEKNNEFSNKNEFIPVKINAKWNKLFSLLYINFADIRNISVKIEELNQKYKNMKIKYILNTISSKWLVNSTKLPYIKEVNHYINEDYMEKPYKIQEEIYY